MLSYYRITNIRRIWIADNLSGIGKVGRNLCILDSRSLDLYLIGLVSWCNLWSVFLTRGAICMYFIQTLHSPVSAFSSNNSHVLEKLYIRVDTHNINFTAHLTWEQRLLEESVKIFSPDSSPLMYLPGLMLMPPKFPFSFWTLKAYQGLPPFESIPARFLFLYFITFIIFRCREFHDWVQYCVWSWKQGFGLEGIRL